MRSKSRGVKPVVAGPLDSQPLDDAIVDHLTQLVPAAVDSFRRVIDQTSLDVDLSYIRDNGETIQIPLVAVPAVPNRRLVKYLTGLCEQLGKLVAGVAECWLSDPRVQELLPLESVEADWLRLAQSAPGHATHRVFHRWDCTLDLANDPTGRGARFFEVNSVDVGGVHYAPAAREVALAALQASGFHRLSTDAESGGRDVRKILAYHLRTHAHALHRPLQFAGIAENQDFSTGITEAASLARFLTQHGIATECVDARALELDRKNRVCFRGRPLDVIYRNIETRDLAELEAAGQRLDGMRSAAESGLLLSSPFGDLDHKSLWEVLGSAEFANRYSVAERRLIARHIPWTRLIYARRTDDVAGRSVDLPEYVRANRERLVMKPNRSCGGQGVTLGLTVSQSQWDAVLRRAMRVPRTWIAQELIPIPRRRGFRFGPRGRLDPVTLYTVYGVFASPRGVGFVARASFGDSADSLDDDRSAAVGFVGRASHRPVVNVMQGGGLLPVLGRGGR